MSPQDQRNAKIGDRVSIAIVAGLLLLVLSLAACDTPTKPEPEIRIVERVVPGPLRSCIPADMPPEPDYPDTDDALRAAGAMPERYQLVMAGRELRDAYLGIVRKLLPGCR
jgi:hypothetical protein